MFSVLSCFCPHDLCPRHGGDRVLALIGVVGVVVGVVGSGCVGGKAAGFS